MKKDLHIKLTLDLRSDELTLTTNVKEKRLKDLMGEVVRSQIGAGEDNNPIKKRDVYTINVSIDLSCDAISITSDCGNKGLETGILAEALVRMDETGKIT